MDAELSIITRTHGGRFDKLKRAWQSVQNQTYTPTLEWIIVEDGSRLAADWAETIGKASPNRLVRYIEDPRLGRLAAANAGLEAARGNHRAFSMTTTSSIPITARRW